MALLLYNSYCSTFRNKLRIYGLHKMLHHTFKSKTLRSFNGTHFLVIPKRTIMYSLFKGPTIEKLRIIDKLPDCYNLIYRNTMHRYLLIVQIITSVLASLVTILVVYSEVSEIEWQGDLPARSIENEKFIYLASFILFCVSLQVIVLKSPIRIYNWPKEQQYVFVFYGLLPSTRNRLVCKVSDIVKSEETGILPWRNSRYKIRNSRNILIVENYFRKPADFNIMLGYQKQPEDYD